MSANQLDSFLAVDGDVVELRHTCKFELAHAEQATAAVTENRRRYPRTFVLASTGHGATPESRKFMTEWLKASPSPVEAAVWGGGTLHRAVAEMIVRGVQVFRPNQFIVTFHATRDDALAWIAKRRGMPAPK
jgi:hypothetical protein